MLLDFFVGVRRVHQWLFAVCRSCIARDLRFRCEQYRSLGVDGAANLLREPRVTKDVVCRALAMKTPAIPSLLLSLQVLLAQRRLQASTLRLSDDLGCACNTAVFPIPNSITLRRFGITIEIGVASPAKFTVGSSCPIFILLLDSRHGDLRVLLYGLKLLLLVCQFL